jgi:antitoxin component YwqK of YwqJK toxin-antitoxin module
MKVMVLKISALLTLVVLVLSSCGVYNHKINSLSSDGVKHGLWITTDTVSNIYIAKYQNGLRDGKYKSFHPNGKIRSQGKYGDGKRIGLWKFYFDNGFLYKELKFDKKGERKTISLYNPVNF